MKPYIICIGLLFFLSCVKSDPNRLIIDLDQSEESIKYSTFIDSISYIELNTKDTCLLSDIEKIYIDNDTILVWDKKEAGILTFNSSGELIKQINYYGKGPQEFITISAFCIDPERNIIYIWDYPSQRINKYTYSGEFIGYDKSDSFVRDFTVLGNEDKLCILPFYSKYSPYGIWISDINNKTIREFNIPIPIDDQVEFSGTYYNVDNDSIFIYDRNFDNLYKIVNDSISVTYSFDVKQVLARHLRKKDPSSLLPFKGIAYMSNFSISANYLLQTYYYYNIDNPYRWVLLNRKDNKLSICEHLVNDIDFVETEYPHIYYIKNDMWCRVVETDVNDCNMLLQLLHIRTI